MDHFSEIQKISKIKKLAKIHKKELSINKTSKVAHMLQLLVQLDFGSTMVLNHGQC